MLKIHTSSMVKVILLSRTLEFELQKKKKIIIIIINSNKQK